MPAGLQHHDSHGYARGSYALEILDLGSPVRAGKKVDAGEYEYAAMSKALISSSGV